MVATSPPARQYTELEKEELGIEEEEGKIWISRVVEDAVQDAVTLEGGQTEHGGGQAADEFGR